MIVRRNLYRRKLNHLLQLARDEQFLVMCWAMNAVQTSRAHAASGLLEFPPETVTEDLASRWKIHPWSIETLVNELLTVPKHPRMLTGSRVLNCSKFASMRSCYNALHGLENAEDGIALGRVNVLREMHRLAQRQIEWQRGFWNVPHLYRSAYIFGGEQASSHFSVAKGFTLHDFSLACTIFLGLFQNKPSIIINGGALKLGKEVLEAAMMNISLPISEARAQAAAIRGRVGHTSYKPSLLRLYPCVRFEDRYVAPLPELVTVRSTTGVFYDMVSGPSAVRREIGCRFEIYCRESLVVRVIDSDRLL